MDVRCERCGTEYDFDDALVSERGTTVKCTNCGHQFKVFPIRASGIGPERWVVRTESGEELTFESLRDLQKGIADGKVGPDDQLSRGGRPPRPLSSIAELEPFFRTSIPSHGVGGRTLAGVAPPAEPSLPHSQGRAAESTGRTRGATAPRLPTFDQTRPSGTPNMAVPATRPGPRPDERIRPAVQGHLRSGEDEFAKTIPGGSMQSPFAHESPSAPARASAAGAARAEADAASAVGASSAAAKAERASAAGASAASANADSAAQGKKTLAGGTVSPALDPDVKRAEKVTVTVPPAAPPDAPPTDAKPSEVTTAPAMSDERVTEPRGSVTESAVIAVDAEPPISEAVPTSPSVPPQEPTHDQPQVVHSSSSAPPPPPAAAPVPAKVTPGGTLASFVIPEEATASRPVPAVAPVEPAPLDPAEAGAHRETPRDSDQYFTPPPRELSFSGSLSDPDPRYVPKAKPRGARTAWIVGLVVVGAMLLIGGTVGLSFVRQQSPALDNPPTPAADPRIAEFVKQGRKLMGEGDLDGAAQQLAEARVLAEQDPEVLAALAELELVRADVLWLQLRLLDRSMEDRVSATRAQLGAKIKRARQAVDAAVNIAPQDLAVVRGRVDLLRLSGKLSEARQHVDPLSKNASEPSNAYVLAALDLAEAEPAYKSAIERLRTAAGAEGGVGRARGALIYALALDGDLDTARSELTTLSGANAAHPLLPDLRDFVRRVSEGGGEVLNADELGNIEGPPDGPLPKADDPADFRTKLKQANAALRGGQLARAERLYNAVLADQPRNTEAMAGLAEVARKRNDPNAGKLYDKVLEANGSYLPALVARADLKWDSGDRAGALVLYRRVLSQAGPNTTYGRHAQSRIAEASSGGAPTPKTDPVPPTPKTDPEPPAPKTDPEPPATSSPPEIDTTDLPGFQ